MSYCPRDDTELPPRIKALLGPSMDDLIELGMKVLIKTFEDNGIKVRKMSDKWPKAVRIERKPTGRFYFAKIGPYRGITGKEVNQWGWGGIDLQFDDGQVVTFAMGDVEAVDLDYAKYMQAEIEAGLATPTPESTNTTSEPDNEIEF